MKLSEILVRYMEETAQTDNNRKTAKKFIWNTIKQSDFDIRIPDEVHGDYAMFDNSK